MKYTLGIILIVLLATKSQAQQFINSAQIEFAVTQNIKKTLSNDMWGDMLKDNISEFKQYYCNYVFANNKSIYQFDRWDDKTKIPAWYKESDEENKWFFDFTTQHFNMQKNIDGTNLNIADSIPAIEWKISNENRVIAGFNCRKAVGKIMDSVYVFAFYTDEITISGGPCSLHGLPGMILGLTIPRLYISYIATKVTVNNVDETKIKAATAKKYYSYTGLKTLIEEKSKDWFRWGEDDAENKRQKSLFLWNIYL